MEEPTSALDALEPGTRGVFVRVSDSDPEMLRWLGERGITPGAAFEIVERVPFGGPLVAASATPSMRSALSSPVRCGSTREGPR